MRIRSALLIIMTVGSLGSASPLAASPVGTDNALSGDSLEDLQDHLGMLGILGLLGLLGLRRREPRD